MPCQRVNAATPERRREPRRSGKTLSHDDMDFAYDEEGERERGFNFPSHTSLSTRGEREDWRDTHSLACK